MLEPTVRGRDAVARVREFVRDEVMPLESKMAAGAGFRALLPDLEALRARAKAHGIWAPHLPREHGGMGLSLYDYAFVSEELGRTPLGHYTLNCQAPDVGNMELLLAHGTPVQKMDFFEPLAAGTLRSCFSMTEPDHAGSNPVWMSTRAEKVGGDYVISGRKWFTSSADGAAFAIVMAVTNPDAESPYARASQILVPLSTPGVRIVRNLNVMGDPGEDWASHAEVLYENVRVPQENRIGAEGAGFLLAQERLGPGRIHHCMRWIGIAERAMDLMCKRAASRSLSPGKPLGTRQVVQMWIAESRAEIHASRLMVLSAAYALDREQAEAPHARQRAEPYTAEAPHARQKPTDPGGARGGGPHLTARDQIGIIKFFVAGVLQRVLDRAIQTHGALGLTDETPLAGWYRHERAARIYDGPDEVHKVALARRILRGYGLDVRS
jgi:alkylation response protein AidB-like acyl-CoA dehydrogenase